VHLFSCVRDVSTGLCRLVFLSSLQVFILLEAIRKEPKKMYAALLKSLDDITVKKRRNEVSNVEKKQHTDICHDTSNVDENIHIDGGTSKRRLWLTEASLARLTEKILNGVENSLISPSKSNHFKVDVTKLDARYFYEFI